MQRINEIVTLKQQANAMKCSEEDMRTMLKNAPGLLKEFQRLDPELQTHGYEILLYENDHMYDSFRWALVPLNHETTSSSQDTLRTELHNRIVKIEESTCCVCGSKTYVELRPMAHRYDSGIFMHKCTSCYAMSGAFNGQERVHMIAALNYTAHCKHENLPLPRLKVRLLGPSGRIFYEHIENIYYDGSELYVSNQHATKEVVQYGGVDLGIRTDDGERVYEGDILRIKQKRGNNFCWGLAILSTNKDMGYQEGKTRAMLFDGWDYGVIWGIPLDSVSSVKIIGNTISGHEKEFPVEDLLFLFDKHRDDYFQLFGKMPQPK